MQAARELGEEAVEAFRQVLGPNHFVTMQVMNNLVETLRVSDELQAARSLAEETLGSCREVLGQKHPLTLTVMNNLAATLRLSGDLPGCTRTWRGGARGMPGNPRAEPPGHSHGDEQPRGDL